MFFSAMKLICVVPIFFLLEFHLSNANDCQHQTPDGIVDLRVFGYPDRPKYTDIPDSDSKKALRYSFNGCFSYSTKGNCRNAAACVSK